MITLQANKFVATLTNLIAYSTYLDIYTLGDPIYRTLDVFRSDDTANGSGKYNFTTSICCIITPSTSSLLTVSLPTIKEQYMPISGYKKVSLTINEYLMRGAFVSYNSMATLISYLIGTMRTAKTLFLYSQIIEKLSELADDTTGTTVVGLAKPSSATTAVELNAIRTYNTNTLFRTLKSTLREWSLGNKKVGPTTAQLNAYFNGGDIVCFLTPDTLSSLDVDTLATLLNSNKIGVNVEFIEIIDPNQNLLDGQILMVGKDTIQYGFFYQVATTFFDASNLNTQNWLHFAYYLGVAQYGMVDKITLSNFWD